MEVTATRTRRTRTSRAASAIASGALCATVLAGCGSARHANETIARLSKLDVMQAPPGGVLVGHTTSKGGGPAGAATQAGVVNVYAVPGSIDTVRSYYLASYPPPHGLDEYTTGLCQAPACIELKGGRDASSNGGGIADVFTIAITIDSPAFHQEYVKPLKLDPSPPGHNVFVLATATGGNA